MRPIVSENAERYLSWLTEACSIPSVARRDDDLDAMARWLQERLAALGGDVQCLGYGDAPDAVLASFGSGSRRVLVYDHYDVQPTDPLDLWVSDPFAPEVRDGRVYARGASDNKGDLVARLAGIECFLSLHGELPFTLKFLVEGEEESGSRSFPALVESHGDKLAADGCIWEGDGIDHAGRPKLVFGAKGLAYAELTLVGLSDDQHSMLAVIAPSPAWHMVEALATLRSPDGRVLIDGFYDDVRPPSAEDLSLLKDLVFDEDAERARLGIDAFIGDLEGRALLERYYFQPTCNIAGIVSGFTEPNASKTVLPKAAMAKIDMRLVPDQDPDDIVDKLRKHLDANGFSEIAIKTYSMEHPVRSPVDSSIGAAALRAAQATFDAPPFVAPMMIGTGPMYPIAGTLGIPTVSPPGVCRPDSNIHAPNEQVRIDDFLAIVDYTVSWLEAFADVDA